MKSYANILLEKLGKEKLKLHIEEMKFKMELLTDGMKEITKKSIAELEAIL